MIEIITDLHFKPMRRKNQFLKREFYEFPKSWACVPYRLQSTEPESHFTDLNENVFYREVESDYPGF